MADTFSIGATLAKLAAATAAPNFDLQFSRLQNTIIRRVNDEIARVNESGAVNKHRVEKLQRDGLKLADSLPLMAAYRVGNENNLGQLQQLIADTETLSSSLGSDDVDQSEVDAFNAQLAVVVDRLENIYVYIHPDINDAKAIQYLKQKVDTLNALTPVVGTQADNQAVIDAVAAFQDQTQSALDTTQNTIILALGLEENIQSNQADILAQFEELTTVDKARKTEEINNIKADYANLLTAISITFETNKNYAAELNKFLTPFTPEPGSILNLFS
jgi:hypothetical protein